MKLSIPISEKVLLEIKRMQIFWGLKISNTLLKFQVFFLKFQIFFLKFQFLCLKLSNMRLKLSTLYLEFRICCLETGDPFVRFHLAPYVWFCREFSYRFLQQLVDL